MRTFLDKVVIQATGRRIHVIGCLIVQRALHLRLLHFKVLEYRVGLPVPNDGFFIGGYKLSHSMTTAANE